MTPELNAKLECREALIHAINATNCEDWKELRHEAQRLAEAADKVLSVLEPTHDTAVPF